MVIGLASFQSQGGQFHGDATRTQPSTRWLHCPPITLAAGKWPSLSLKLASLFFVGPEHTMRKRGIAVFTLDPLVKARPRVDYDIALSLSLFARGGDQKCCSLTAAQRAPPNPFRILASNEPRPTPHTRIRARNARLID